MEAVRRLERLLFDLEEAVQAVEPLSDKCREWREPALGLVERIHELSEEVRMLLQDAETMGDVVEFKCPECNEFYDSEPMGAPHVVQTDGEGGYLLCTGRWEF